MRTGNPENLNPVKPGEVRNPEGQNQHTYCREFERTRSGAVYERARGGPMAREVRKEMREATVKRLEYQCPACGEWYVPNRSDQVYCSEPCKHHAYRQRCKYRAGSTCNATYRDR